MRGAPSAGSGAHERRDGPSWLTKLLVITLLLAFVGLAVNRVEAWPLTAWRLFSERRGPSTTAYRAFAVSTAGDERAVKSEDLPLAYRQVGRILLDFPRLREQQRREVCEAVAQGVLGRSDRPLAEVRVYRVVEHTRIVRGEPERTTTRELRFSCNPREGRG